MKKYSFLFLSIYLLNSCATVLRGKDGNPSKRIVEISGEPANAEIYYNGEKIGDSPLTYTFKTLRKDATLKIKKEGYISEYLLIERKLNAGAATLSILGNLPITIYSAFVPWAIIMDFRNGSVYDAPSSISYNLKEKQ